MAWGLVVEGALGILSALSALRGPAAISAALTAEGEGIADAARQLVPIETGALRESIAVRGPRIRGSEVEVEVVAFAVNPSGSAYAIPVHEIPPPPSKSVGGRSARHQWGTWKYLQIPLLMAADGMESRVGSSIKAELNI